MWNRIFEQLSQGALVTLEVFVISGILGLFISLLVGLVRSFAPAPIKFILATYVEVFRGTSAFVQIYWVYFVLPLFGFQMSAVIAGSVVLALNVGAYGSEIIRGAIRAVPRGQLEAATSLHLPRWATALRIVLPQALIRAIGPMTNQLIDLLKGTSLLSIMAISELTFSAKQLNVTFFDDAALIFGFTLVLYFAMGAPIAWLGARAESAMDLRLKGRVVRV